MRMSLRNNMSMCEVVHMYALLLRVLRITLAYIPAGSRRVNYDGAQALSSSTS
jgi:hypothetical protein